MLISKRVPRMRPELGERRAELDANRLLDADPAPRRVLHADADAGRSPRRTRAALPSITGTSGPSISISRVVDAEAGERRQQMLDGGDGGAVRIAEHGAELGRADGMRARRDFDVGGIRKVAAEEDDAAVRIGRAERDRDRRAAMDADAGKADPPLQRPLPIARSTNSLPLHAPRGSARSGCQPCALARICRTAFLFCRES